MKLSPENFEQLDRGVPDSSIPNKCPECLESFDYKIHAGDVSGITLNDDGFRGEMCFSGGSVVEYFFVHESAPE